MRKRGMLFLSVCMLALTIAPAAVAAETITVQVNGDAVVYPDAQPYERGDALMVPVRATAEKLGIAVRYEAASKSVLLSDGSRQAALAIAEAKQGRAYVPLAYFEEEWQYQAAYDAQTGLASITSKAFDAEEFAVAVIDLLRNGQYEALWNDYFDPTLQEAVPVYMLEVSWTTGTSHAGAYLGTKDVQSAILEDGTWQIAGVVEFEAIRFNLMVTLTGEGRISGLLIQPAPVEAESPETVVEEEVTVGEGTAFPLGGTLTLPKEADGPLPAVVLVQGSGASDRDETASAYKPFRDIAWGLAEQGIAVLRYDKRTYAYAQQLNPQTLTVQEESVEDAIAAANLLKSDSRIDAERVYLVGHSQGGMLAPRIDTTGGDFAGIVMLAGTPRTLWEIIYDQQMNFLAAMEDSDPAKAANEAYIAAEHEKAKSIAAMTEEEAAQTTIYGIPANYFKEMDSFDAGAIAARLDKPILIMQGEDDFQVFADKDYVLWQELLSGKANVTFKLYPGLNHFFVDYTGPSENTLNEYSFPGVVSPEVIQDLADWIQAHS